jgi:hypothetical protein
MTPKQLSVFGDEQELNLENLTSLPPVSHFVSSPPPVPVFYNTIHLEGDEKKEVEAKFSKQELEIISVFKRVKTILTPFDVQRYYEENNPAVPITSIRRAMTNLTEKGKLEKLSKEHGMKDGNYGKPNHYWKLIVNNQK